MYKYHALSPGETQDFLYPPVPVPVPKPSDASKRGTCFLPAGVAAFDSSNPVVAEDPSRDNWLQLWHGNMRMCLRCLELQMVLSHLEGAGN